MLTASPFLNARPWRRLMAGLLALCIGLSSAESLWGDVPAGGSGPEHVLAAEAGSDGLSSEADAPGEEPEEDCPCLCDCACVNAQRVVQPGPALIPGFNPSVRLRLARRSPGAPGSVDLEPHLRPPQA